MRSLLLIDEKTRGLTPKLDTGRLCIGRSEMRNDLNAELNRFELGSVPELCPAAWRLGPASP